MELKQVFTFLFIFGFCASLFGNLYQYLTRPVCEEPISCLEQGYIDPEMLESCEEQGYITPEEIAECE